MAAYQENGRWFLSDGYELRSIKPWKHPGSYAGCTWRGWFCGVGRSRDSSCLEESNFTVFLHRLRKLPEVTVDDEENADAVYWRRPDYDHDHCLSSVQVVRESHWAVGWVEWIAVHGSDEAALRAADEMLRRIDGYPVLDEDHFSDLERQQADEWWASETISCRIDWCKECGESIFAARYDYPPEKVFDLLRENL